MSLVFLSSLSILNRILMKFILMKQLRILESFRVLERLAWNSQCNLDLKIYLPTVTDVYSSAIPGEEP